jgi:hypothetical protein
VAAALVALGYEPMPNPSVVGLAYALGLEPGHIFTFRPTVQGQGQALKGFERDARACGERVGAVVTDVAAWPVFRTTQEAQAACDSSAEGDGSAATPSEDRSAAAAGTFSGPAGAAQRYVARLPASLRSPTRPCGTVLGIFGEARAARWAHGRPAAWRLQGGGLQQQGGGLQAGGRAAGGGDDFLSVGEKRGDAATAGPCGTRWEHRVWRGGGGGLADGTGLVGELDAGGGVAGSSRRPGAWLHRRPFHPFKPDRLAAQAEKAARQAHKAHRSDLRSFEVQMNGVTLTLEEVDDDDDDDDDDGDFDDDDDDDDDGNGFQK